jgi:thioredoxin reductase
MFDVLIIGGGVSGISCSLILGSAENMDFVSGKNRNIYTSKNVSQEAIFNNAYGIAPGLGSDLLKQSTQNLSNTYPHIIQIQTKST